MKENKYIEDKENHKININNFVIYNNNILYESKEYFMPKTDGEYHIKIFIKNNLNDCFGLFFCCDKIINIDLSSFNAKNVTNMSHMFYECSKLTNINLSSFDTKNVTNMSSMFSDCSNLTNINLSSFDTKNFTDMSWMFSYCSNFKY